MTATRPVLRYHGGKWRLASWVISHFPPHRVYVEPYGGAMSVLLRKEPSKHEIYNDIDKEVVNVFRVLRDPKKADRLRELLELTPYSRVEFWDSYEPSDDPVEQARRTISRSFMSFGVTWRRKNRTGFRSGHGRRNQGGVTDWRNFPRHLPAVVERLRNVVIECRDAIELIKQHDRIDTLFYVEPPYPLSTRASGRHRAYAADLTDDEHRELAAVLRAVKGLVAVSGYPCDLYDKELYHDWRRIEKPALGDSGVKRVEVLWLSPNTADVEGLFAMRGAVA